MLGAAEAAKVVATVGAAEAAKVVTTVVVKVVATEAVEEGSVVTVVTAAAGGGGILRARHNQRTAQFQSMRTSYLSLPNPNNKARRSSDARLAVSAVSKELGHAGRD